MKRALMAVAMLALLISGIGLVANSAAASQSGGGQINNQAQSKPVPRYGVGGKISLPPAGNWQQSGGPADTHPVAQPSSPNGIPVFGTDVNVSSGNETSISANPTNPLNWVAGANSVGRFTTTDGGVTWNVGSLSGGGDPATAFDAAGRAYFAELGNTSSCPDNPVLYKSTNGGLAWTSTTGPLSDPSPSDHFFDKEWITVDNNPSSPHLGRIYVTASVFHTPAGCDLNNYIDNREVIAYSDDQGQTWSQTTTVSDASHNQDQFTKPVAASNGTVYVTYQYQNCTFNCNGIPAYQMITKSTDGGVTWSPSITITGQPISYTGSSVAGYQYLYAGSTSSGFRHNDQPVSAVSPTNPNQVYAIWSDGRFESTFVYQGVTGWHGDIVFSRSTDGGSTWSNPIKINDDNVQGKDQFFPWLVVGSDGTLHASWMDRRDAAVNGFPYREYYSQSTDGGLTWSANQAVADVGGIPSSFIGDYSGIDVNANNSIVMPVWTDSRSGQNVYVDPGHLPAATPTPTITPGGPTLTPTNTATATATASPTPCLSPNVIQNPGFETGSLPPWVALGTNNPPAVSTAQAHSGTHSALMGVLSGGEPTGDSSIYETVTVPLGNSQLSYYYWPFTTDTISFDWQDAYVVSTTGTILATVMHVDENTQAWTNKTFDMSPYAGQTVRIEFLVHEDGFGDDTAMYVDDVSLQSPVSCGSPVPTDTSTPSPTDTPIPATDTPMPPTDTPMPPTDTPVPPTQTPGGPTATPQPTDTLAPTNTPGGPTNTPAAPTVTPTDCPNVFVDITGNVFYGAIHYLNCRGVVNGVDATHYGPGGTSTRGQFAKVVVLGFGIPLSTPTGGQSFTDVPPSYFAYVYIESGFANGVLNGFDAAGCTSHGATFPCYLPNLAITRGQLTKLVVSAGHYPLYTPTVPDFIDVLPTNVFYVSIETAFHNSVVGGYPDHTFRPNNNIRRDEMAQIVFEGIIHMP